MVPRLVALHADYSLFRLHYEALPSDTMISRHSSPDGASAKTPASRVYDSYSASVSFPEFITMMPA